MIIQSNLTIKPLVNKDQVLKATDFVNNNFVTKLQNKHKETTLPIDNNAIYNYNIATHN